MAVIHAESEVRNEDSHARTFIYRAQVLDADGREVARFQGSPVTLQPGETRIVKAQQAVSGGLRLLIYYQDVSCGRRFCRRHGHYTDGLPQDTLR